MFPRGHGDRKHQLRLLALMHRQILSTPAPNQVGARCQFRQKGERAGDRSMASMRKRNPAICKGGQSVQGRKRAGNKDIKGCKLTVTREQNAEDIRVDGGHTLVHAALLFSLLP